RIASSPSNGASRGLGAGVGRAPVLGPILRQRPRIVFAFEGSDLLCACLEAAVRNPLAHPLRSPRCNIGSSRRTIDVASAGRRRTPGGRQLAAFNRTLHRRNKVPTAARLATIPAVALATINASIRRRVQV